MTEETPPTARRLGPFLIIGIIAAPILFAWFTLRRGHTRSSRYAAFTHLALGLFVGVLNAADQAASLAAADPAPAAPPARDGRVALGTMTQWDAARDGVEAHYLSGPLKLTLSSKPQADGPPLPTLTVEGAGLPPFTVEGSPGFNTPSASFGVGPLDPGNPVPQVLFATYTGGAHCCIRTQIAEARDGRWVVAELGQWDGDGVRFPEDVDGDGIRDIVESDDRFLYAFDAYAYAMPPPVVLNYAGGKARDVSDQPRYAALFASHMAQAQAACLKASNAACAAFVADAARLGRREWAWDIMLKHHDRAATWGLPEDCVVPRVAGACPEGRERKPADFPQALEWFLEDAGYFAAARPSAR